MKKLRPRQEQAIYLLKKSLAEGHKRPLVMAPTGFGKTVLASHIVQGAVNKGNRVKFVVPAISLIDQTIDSFRADGIDAIGVIQGNHELTDSRKPVQVASIQTLARRKNIPPADVVIIDEAHRQFKFYRKWFDEWSNIPFIGLSATPWSKGLGKLYDDLIISCETQDLIDDGLLSPFKVFAPSKPDMKGVRTVAGDWHEGDSAKAMQPLTADIVKTWKEKGENKNTLAFAVDRAHANSIKEQFELAGIPCGYIDAYTDLEERDRIRDQLLRGDIRVVANVGCLTTGIDWDIRCIILARPTKSEMLFVQIIGRGLRTAEGKDYCTILDHSDTHARLGFVTDIHHDTLCDGKPNESAKVTKEKEEKLPKKCDSCHYMKPAGVHTCPLCGFEPKKRSDVEVAAGELKEITKSKSKATMLEKRESYAQFLGYAMEKGYQRGWAAHKYKELHGVWPSKMKDVKPIASGPEIRAFIKHLNIKRAKGRAA